MAYDFEKFVPLGGMASDLSPEAIKEGNYTTNTKNVRSVTESGSSNPFYIPIRGNTLAVSIPDTVSQSKIYAVAVNSVNTTHSQLSFSDNNGFIVNTASFVITAGTLSTTFNASIRPAIQNALTSVGITSIVTLSPPSGSQFGFVIITLTNRIGLDYIIKSIGIDDLSVFVKQDAIDFSLAGPANVIGSYDLLGDLFVWSTSSTNLPTVLNLPNSSTPMNINTIVGSGISATATTNSPHGLSVNQKITITGSSNSSYNSSFVIISVLGPTTFTISNNFGNSLNGNIILYPMGIGEVGVIQYDANTDIYSYTRLIKSSQLNFRIQKQIDSYVEQNSFQKSLYWTDDYNVPRVMYYKGNYVQDGFLSFYDSLNTYDLDTINIETRLAITDTATSFNFNNQSQSGGNVKSGNWRYAIRFVSDSGIATSWSDLSNPVPVFKSSTLGDPNVISGDAGDVITSKINNFTVSNIIPNIFKYIELAGINYVNGAIIGYILSRNSLSNAGTINISHTGFETNVQTLDLGSLNVQNTVYATAKNINAIDNRLILSNLTINHQVDFSAWTSTWTHTIQRAVISSVGNVGTLSYKVAEYSNVNNVYSVMGYMANETYRFMAKFRMKDGTITDGFWIDDIRFDTSLTNINNETPNRRVTPDLFYYNSFQITNNSVTEVYFPYPQFSNINLDFVIDGKKVRELIDEIFIERAECIPEILATGMSVMSVTDNGSVGVLISPNVFIHYNTPGGSVQYGEYPFTTGRANDSAHPLYPDGAFFSHKIFSFYSPDIIYGNRSLSFLNGDTIINFGQPQTQQDRLATGGASAGVTYGSYFTDYAGNFNFEAQASNINVTNLINLDNGSSAIIGGTTYTKALQTYSGSSTDSQWNYISSPVINTGVDLTPVTIFSDYGIYYTQYKRTIPYSSPDNCKYGNRNLTISIPTGTTLLVNEDTISPSFPSNTLNVFGGDVFTQKTYLKTRFPFKSSSLGDLHLGWGGGIGFYSQNRVNSQLNVRYGNGNGEFDYPNIKENQWLEQIEVGLINYNFGYNIKNGIDSTRAFDGTLVQINDMPARIAWSDLKPQDGVSDNYRLFLPLNFKDLDLAQGEVFHHANGNGELLTWQPRKFQRQFFNTRGVLQQNELDILIGDGSVMNRDGVTLSVYGTTHKWSVIRGKGSQGNDAFYWINSELKKAMRFGYDGTISLAEIKDMESFFANNITWAGLYDNPASGNGICGFWDDRYQELGWTMFGKRIEDVFVFNNNYSLGKVVSYTPSVYSTFEKTGELYKSLISNNIHNIPSSSPQFWQLISHDDNNYYNEYTIIFSEYKNKFTAFYDNLAHIYLKWKDSYFSPRPIIGTQGNIYINNQGNYGEWYLLSGNSKKADGVLEGVVNKKDSESNWFNAISMETQNIPYRVDFSTQDQISFLTQSEFTSRMNRWLSPIKQDSTNTSVNNGNTTLLFGEYLKVKLTFKQGLFQKLRGWVIKFKSAARLTTK